MGLKDFFTEKRLQQLRKRPRPESNKPFLLKSVAVFLDENSRFEESHLIRLKDRFGLEIYDFEFFIFSKNKKALHRFHGIDVIPGMLNWKGEISNPNLKRMMEKDYSLLLDYATCDSLQKKILTAEIKAAFRVGYAENLREFYDLIINVPADDVDSFNHELFKYLKIIGLLK